MSQHLSQINPPVPGFLQGSGEMARLIREHNWGATPIGVPHTWPKSLQSTLSILLHSKLPMFLFWGPELLCFYNDAYRPSLSVAGKHPGALGRPGKEVWDEIWYVISPQIEQVLSGGEAILHENDLVPIYRNGAIEDVYCTYSYSPVYAGGNLPEGVLVTCMETTSQVQFRRMNEDTRRELQRLFKQAPTAIMVLRGQQLLVEICNSRALEILGMPEDEVIGRKYIDVYPEAQALGLLALLQQVYESGTLYVSDETPVYFLRDGKKLDWWAKFIFAPTFDAAGAVNGIMITGEDITSQVMARKKIEESEGRLQSLANAMPQLVWMADPDGTVTYYNDRVAEMHGAQQEPDGRWIWEGMIHPDDLKATTLAWQQAVSTGTFFQQEHRVRMKDGSFRWHLSRALPQKDGNGRVGKWFGTATDIHEHKTAEEEIKESGEQLRIALKGGELGLFNYHFKTETLYWSDKAKELFGLPADAAVNLETYRKGIHPDDRERADATVQQAFDLNSGGQYENEYRVVGITDGKLRWVRSKGRVLFDGEGKLERFTGVLQEITAQKEILTSLQLQAQVLERMNEGVSISDENGTIFFTNPAENAMFGYEPGELVGQHVTVQNNYSPEENNRLVAEVIAQLKTKGHWNGEWQNRKKDGTPFFTYSYITAVKVEGKINFVCVQRDITEEKRTGEILQFRKALLEAQNETIPDAILIVDTKGKMVSYNRHFRELWNIPQDIVDQKDDEAALQFAMTQLTDPQGFIDRVTYCYAHPEETAHEEVHFNDGRIIERYGNAVVGDNGTRYGWAWYFRDITEQRKAAEALTYQKQLLETVTDNTSQGLFLMNDRQHCIYMNEAAEAMTGFALAEVQGKQLHYFVHHTHPDGRHYPLEECPIDQALPANRRMQGEEVFVHRDGSFYPVAFTASPILVDGKGVGTVIEVRNTTEEKRKAQELQQAKDQLEITFQNTPSSIYLFDKEGRILFANDNAAVLMGYENAAELLAEKDYAVVKQRVTDTFDMYTEERKPYPPASSPVMRVLQRGEPAEDILLFVRKRDGKETWVLNKSAPLLDSDGVLQMVLTNSTDITAQKNAEEKIRQSEERLRQLADSMPQIVWAAQPDGFVDYFNKQWYEYTGFEEGYGDQSWLPILHPDDAQLCLDTWTHSVKTGEPYQIEYRFKDRFAGGYRWFLGKALPIKNAEGVIAKWFGTCTDINDQKTFAERLEKLVKERTKELERSNADLQQFAHVASHDLKEPVRKVMTFANRLKQELGTGLSQRSNTYLSKIESSAIRMYSMIDGVLLYSSLNALEQTKELIDLNELLQNIESDLEVAIANKEATIRYEDLPQVEGSSILLYQLFYNLLNNSLKFLRPDVKPVIQIPSGEATAAELAQQGLAADKRFVKISVQDNGIGFGPENAEKIFGTFTRLHSKDKFEGTGLGLSLCRKIVERHGGAIYAEGQEEKGATFTILLPRPVNSP